VGAQAIFRRRRHQPSRPPPAKIKPGRLAPAQLIAAHNAAMECYRRAMLGDQTFEGHRENLNQANKLSRTYPVLLDALNRHRGKSQCRSPAMPNGRCRMHGGPSPGAPRGNKNAYKHGLYSAKAIAGGDQSRC
jgi:hypothetical protein